MNREEFYRYYDIGAITDPTVLSQRYFTIIEIKRKFVDLQLVGQSLYLDVKLFINNYIRSKTDKDFGYDEFDRDKILQAINIVNLRAQYLLLGHLERLLGSLGYDTNWIVIEKNERAYLLSFHEKKYFKAAMQFCKFHLWATLLCIIFIFAIWCVVLCPAPCKSLIFFELKQENYCENNVLNFIANVLSLFLGFSNSAKLYCVSVCGVFMLGIFRLFYVVLCANYLFKNLFFKVKIDDTKN